MYSILLKPGAEEDIDGIFNWYQKQRQGLGYEFLLSVEECINTILLNPFFSFNVTSLVRRAVIPRFPYNIYYTIEDDIIFIHVIMHQFRDPEAWQMKIIF